MTDRKLLPLTITFFALAAFSASCADEENVAKLSGDLKAESAIDFGDVQRGIKSEIIFELKNAGDGPSAISGIEYGDNWTSPDYEFKISDPKVTIAPNGIHTLAVSFQPYSEQEMKVTSFFKLIHDCNKKNECQTFTITVSGRGVTSGLIIEPDPVDFGKVLVGSSHTMDVTITNALSVGVDVRSKLNAEGKAELKNLGGLGRFELLSAVQPNGSLLPGEDLLGGGQSITVQVRYVPDPSSSNQPDDGRWVISNCDHSLCEKRIPLKGEGTNTALECNPAQIDFGDVNPNASLTIATRCRNIASESVTITGWRLAAAMSNEFSVEPYQGTPASLAAGAEFVVETTFSPTLTNVGLVLQSALEINGRNPRANRDLDTTRIPLQGKAGGPDIEVTPSTDIEVTPSTLNFGQIVLGTSSTKRILISNNGYSTLTISSINGDVAGTGNYSVDTVSETVDSGNSKVIEVTFTPTNEGAANSQVLIMSDDSDEPEVTIELTGEGLNLPPCRYTLEPISLNFGIVQVLRETTQGFRISNDGGDDCLINDLAIGPGSDPAFDLIDGPQTGMRLAPGAEKTIIVTFIPSRAGLHEGSIPFYISSTSNSNPEILLRGTGSESALLITPNELDFGVIGVNCSTPNRAITIYNTGSQATLIERIEIPAGVTSEFELGSLPMGVPSPPGAGVSIAPGQSTEFTVRYHATNLGVDTGLLHIFERGNTEPYVVPLYGEASTDPVNEDRFTQLETPEVDILFVIDNSCSMSDEQASLTANFASFIQFADAQGLAYQISVVSTDMSGGFGGPQCTGNATPQRPMGMSQAACGYFADGNGTNTQQNPDWRIITPNEQPSPEVAFTAVATQGTRGSGTEKGLESAYQALSSPLITGWNSGFLRPDAYLALIFISDEEDQSPQTVDFYVNYFKAIKGFRNANLFSASAIVVPEGGGFGGSNVGHRYTELAERTGGIFESILTTDWAQALQNLGLSVFGYKSRFFLSNQPLEETIEVLVNGTIVGSAGSGATPSGSVLWTYEAAGNSVNFATLAIPEPGSEILVRYVARCL